MIPSKNIEDYIDDNEERCLMIIVRKAETY